MKNVKYYKKLNKIRKSKNSKKLLIKIFINLAIFIVIIRIMIFFIFQFRRNKIIKPETISPDEIIFKGSKILKTQLLSDYFSRVSMEERNASNENILLDNYLNLSDSNEPKEKSKIKNQFLNFFSQLKNKTVNKIETIFTGEIGNFGNSLINLNNIISYCEIIGCHSIIIDSPKSLIRHPVYIEKLNIKIIPGSEVNCEDEFTICNVQFFDQKFMKAQVRMHYLKEEIMRNIPIVNSDPNALYINLRGGDIFTVSIHPHYSQPPLCFYEKIINNNKFKNIYIISNDRGNVVLDALMNKYNNIVFNHDNYQTDLALLINASNVVASVSSFFYTAIKFNENLKQLWEYVINKLIEKFDWLHHHIYKFDIKYKIYTMKPSDIYFDKMFNWRNSQNQLKLMIEDKCPYDFVLKNPN